jgi:hypothetical protein
LYFHYFYYFVAPDARSALETGQVWPIVRLSGHARNLAIRPMVRACL